MSFGVLNTWKTANTAQEALWFFITRAAPVREWQYIWWINLEDPVSHASDGEKRTFPAGTITNHANIAENELFFILYSFQVLRANNVLKLSHM